MPPELTERDIPPTHAATLREGVTVAAWVALVAWLVAVTLDAGASLSSAYSDASRRLAEDEWLLENCRDPVFHSRMSARTNVCAEVEASARLGAAGAALREVTEVYRLRMEGVWGHWFGHVLGFEALVVVVVLGLVALFVGWMCVQTASRRLWVNDMSIPLLVTPCGGGEQVRYWHA